MNRLKLILNILLGKDLIIYDKKTKEINAMIGNEVILKKKYELTFGKGKCIELKDNKAYFKEEN